VPAVTVRYFAAAREAAGTGRETLAGDTVGAVLDAAVARHGTALASVIGTSRVWVDGEPVPPESRLGGGEEVAILPPVSGGCGDAGERRRRPGSRP
jgi:molybdopterin synthase sulfur carrier subunit